MMDGLFLDEETRFNQSLWNNKNSWLYEDEDYCFGDWILLNLIFLSHDRPYCSSALNTTHRLKQLNTQVVILVERHRKIKDMKTVFINEPTL